VGCCKYQLSEFLIGLILQATLGGAADFKPKHLSGRVLKFVVASSKVGFHIFNNLKSFSYDQHQVFFHLWGTGGAHWMSEYHNYLREEEAQWTEVINKKTQRRQRSYAYVTRSSRAMLGSNRVLTGANRIPVGNHQTVHRSRFSSARRFSSFGNNFAPSRDRRISVFNRIQWPQQRNFLPHKGKAKFDHQGQFHPQAKNLGHQANNRGNNAFNGCLRFKFQI
jgi:hypothetical protein